MEVSFPPGGGRQLEVEVSSAVDWYERARAVLLSKKKEINDASDRYMPDRYRRWCEVDEELERLKRWRRTCSTSSSRGP